MVSFPKAGFCWLRLIALPLILIPDAAFAAEEPSPPVQAIVSGEVRAGITQIRGHEPITLAEAIDAAGGVNEWAFSIVMSPPPVPARSAAPISSQRIKIQDYKKDAAIRKKPLEPGTRVVVLKLKCY